MITTYQVQQQRHTTKCNYWDFVVCALSNNSAEFICERILPNNSFWKTQVPTLSVFWYNYILPEILGRCYTRKLGLTVKSSLDPNGECYCQKKTDDLTATCSNPEKHKCLHYALFPNFTFLVWPLRRFLKS